MLARRERLILELVDDDATRGFAVQAHSEGGPAFRGSGDIDYACGRCRRLLAIGMRQGVFRSYLFRCACGALNRVPSRPLLAIGR